MGYDTERGGIESERKQKHGQWWWQEKKEYGEWRTYIYIYISFHISFKIFNLLFIHNGTMICMVVKRLWYLFKS